MPVVQLKDGNGVLSYWNVTGKGTLDDPYVAVNTDQSVPLLRAILKTLVGSQYNPIDRDSSGRQKVTVDSISGSLTLGTITTLTNAVADLTKITGLTAAQYAAMLSLDPARAAYNNGIRSNLVFKNI